MRRRRALLGMAVLTAVLTPRLGAQAQADSFEVASVKPSNPNPAGPMGAATMVIPAFGRLTATNATLRVLVVTAYQKHPFEVVGGPSWQTNDKFDITARAGDGAVTTDQILERLQTLLTDRFKLKVHTETRDVPIYALVVARNDGKTGAKLKPSTAVCPDVKSQQQEIYEAMAKGPAALAALQPKAGETRPCAVQTVPSTSTPGMIEVKATGQSMSALATLLTQLTGRRVVDTTNLAGLYDFDLATDLHTMIRLSEELTNRSTPVPTALPEAPALLTQLQEGLGLKLESRRGPGEVLVIDSAELPTPD